MSVERLQSADAELNREPGELMSLCQRVLDDFEDSPGPRVALVAPNVAVPFLCDENLLHIALRNLIHNARRHSPPDAPVVVRLNRHGSNIDLVVHDDGEGIPADDLPQIFRRYYRGRNALHRPGAGLGLFLARKIAERHGGDLSVVSQPGQGTDFRIRFMLKNELARS